MQTRTLSGSPSGSATPCASRRGWPVSRLFHTFFIWIVSRYIVASVLLMCGVRLVLASCARYLVCVYSPRYRVSDDCFEHQRAVGSAARRVCNLVLHSCSSFLGLISCTTVAYVELCGGALRVPQGGTRCLRCWQQCCRRNSIEREADRTKKKSRG